MAACSDNVWRSATGTPLTVTMAPRNMGSAAKLSMRASLAAKLSMSAISSSNRSMNTKDGASTMTSPSSWCRRLLSMRAMSSSSARPRPSDRMTVGAGAPGRWMFLIALRSPASGNGGTSRSSRCSRKAARRSSAKAAMAPSPYQSTSSGLPVVATASPKMPAMTTSSGSHRPGRPRSRHASPPSTAAPAARNSMAGRIACARRSGR